MIDFQALHKISLALTYCRKIVLGIKTIGNYSNPGRMMTLEEDGLGGIQTPLAICLLVAWIAVFLCLIAGVKSSGKVYKDDEIFNLSFSYLLS